MFLVSVCSLVIASVFTFVMIYIPNRDKTLKAHVCSSPLVEYLILAVVM